MKAFILALSMVSVAAVSQAQTTDNETVNQRTPFTGAAVNPCSGEPIVFTGSCHSVVHTRTSADGVNFDVHQSCHAAGEGALGNSYTMNVNSMLRSQAPVACGTSQRFRQMTRFITSRVTQNFVMTVTFVVTVDENCQPHVEVDRTESECRGRGGVF